MIYIENNEQQLEILRSNNSDYFCYQLRLLNGQTHEVFKSTSLINLQYSSGSYLFNVDLSELNDGCFYYQLFAGHNEEEINTIVETGLLQKGSFKNEIVEYNTENNNHKTYNG